MAISVRWLGHSAFHLSGGGADVLVDPFLNHNPKAAAKPDEVPADVILLTHGHGDHLGDTVEIATRTGAVVVAIVELATEIATEGVDVRDPNLGGTVQFDWGWVKLVPAWHTAVSPSGTAHTPAGLLIHYDTFPLVATDAEAFKQDVENAGFSQVYVLNPGDTHHVK